MSYKLLFLGHRSLIKNRTLTETAVINIVNKRILISLQGSPEPLSNVSRIINKAGCWDSSEFYIGKTKRRLHDRKLNISRPISKCDYTSAMADHMKTTGHNIKWDHFDILASGKTDVHCKIKETLLIQELQPSLNVNVSVKLLPF